ncbi:diguanylate cyclase with GAF sensor [Mobilisporobacter senegalensis]|uniref:Diguanylate cyclase with GAF sensor n=1 Tax=Mobilisporobacter senegalensis TaxID=1329262 RepID=A0A3N1XAY6_9FIRM|nr:sensor domain-containing diguanylate cyclase [Mobilisporobacter senegalensis]ROR23916.1 diguanylate cyclase with GAF sensor [Mobilisporobacter senegalensis]
MNPEQFEKYQFFTEKTINTLSQKVTVLENKLNMLTNLLEISKYINTYIKDPNLFRIINDMLIGVFGAEDSIIYIKINDEYYEANDEMNLSFIKVGKKLIMDHNEEEFIISNESPIYECQDCKKSVYSCLGVPIKVDNRLLGFILVQHREKRYFTKDHAIFLSSISNHIGVAIENNFLYKQIKDSANRDGLTELFNKRYFFETLNLNPNLSEENYSIAMLDLDEFKYINDTYGHPYGDMALIKVGNIINNYARPKDIAARYGGDEIIVYFNNLYDKEEVLRYVEIIRQEIERTIIKDDNILFSITASFGVYCKYNETLTLDEVIKKVDDILYQSKRSGKNRITIN